jgi:hypothetical protein
MLAEPTARPIAFPLARPLVYKYGDLQFQGGNLSIAALMDLYTGYSYRATQTPTSGGSLTVNGQSLGDYDWVMLQGNQTISSFTDSDWFTATQDSRSAFIFVNGDLTIDSGQTLIPSVRKLFTAIYVRGTLTVNGSISMTARGANHSATGSNITAQDIRLANGVFSAITNPIIPAVGGAGGPVSQENYAYNAGHLGVTGGSGTGGGTGGGGTGGLYLGGGGSGPNIKSPGSAGTCFTGGTGGGGRRRISSSTVVGNTGGKDDGGSGGTGSTNANHIPASGGAGNPAGPGAGTSPPINASGTAGTLIIFCNALNLAGQIDSNGTGVAQTTGQGGGGAGGGGSVNVFTHSLVDLGGAVTAAGGNTAAPAARGGPGGTGTARILTMS